MLHSSPGNKRHNHKGPGIFLAALVMTTLFLYVGNILTGAGQANRSMLNAGDGGLGDRVADLEKKLLTFQRRCVSVSQLLIASSKPFIDLLKPDILPSIIL